jgi:hypothetical protein
VPTPFVKALKFARTPAGRKVLKEAVKIARSEEGRKLIAQARKVATSPEGKRLIEQARRIAHVPANAAHEAENTKPVKTLRERLAKWRS